MAIRKKAVWGVIALGVAGIFSAALWAQERTVWSGVYSAEQAARGAVLFDKHCAQCHGPSGEGGGMAPALVGAAFSANYDGQTVGDLFDRDRTTMPPDKIGEFSPQEHADILAAILEFNKFPAGPTALPSQSMTLKTIKYLAEKP
jgi:S-disulfanyl-L-cysteine oxidoreductase SoxD